MKELLKFLVNFFHDLFTHGKQQVICGTASNTNKEERNIHEIDFYL